MFDHLRNYCSNAVGESKSQQYNGYGMIASHVPLLPVEVRASLKQQAFMRPERMKEMLEAVQSVLVQSAPDLRSIMKVRLGMQ